MPTRISIFQAICDEQAKRNAMTPEQLAAHMTALDKRMADESIALRMMMSEIRDIAGAEGFDA